MNYPSSLILDTLTAVSEKERKGIVFHMVAEVSQEKYFSTQMCLSCSASIKPLSKKYEQLLHQRLHRFLLISIVEDCLCKILCYFNQYVYHPELILLY